MSNFAVFSLTPADFQHPGIAIATTRAGGVGIIDLEFSADPKFATANWEALRKNAQSEIGLRFPLSRQDFVLELVAGLTQPCTLVICGQFTPESLNAFEQRLGLENCRLLVELSSAENIIGLDSLPVSGIVARGSECGGRVGEDSAFILAQKLLARAGSLPIYVHGGIGVHSAAACLAAGCAGVVLEEQLFLLQESGFPGQWRQHLENLNGQEASLIGERLGSACRVLTRPGFAAPQRLQRLAQQAEIEDFKQAGSGAELWSAADDSIGFAAPDAKAWPIGQAIGLAGRYRDLYKTVGRFLKALRNSLDAAPRIAANLQVLNENSALARSHGTRYPIVQGPMTRVSDTAEFAAAIAQAGGLPMLALAMMREEQAKTLLAQTAEMLAGQPWGVGLLGFAPHQLREGQMRAISAHKPTFALIAGGRPDQAAEFEAMGIPAYIHVPVPRLLKMFFEQGARRFVFEGRECGGHVGPLSSFVLWESQIDTLLDNVPRHLAADVHVLFAGGIHDQRSAAMVAALAAPLAERGIKVGVIMGTAYLFTEEAVGCGAILPEFQRQALACTSTVNLETGPGHASRCAVTPFAHEFFATRNQLIAEGKTAEEVKDALELLNLGRLRIAAKGTARDQAGNVHRYDEAAQVDQGMYMIGQVATLRDRVLSIADLHAEVCLGSTARLSSFASRPAAAAGKPADIAIVGIGTLLPKAQAPETYWRNILDGVNCLTEVPRERWDWRLYFDPDRRARDKVYSRWGGFLDDVAFDPLHYGIPPNSLRTIDPMQLLALEVVRRGLADAGYEGEIEERERTSVIFGAGGGAGDLGTQYAVRSEIPRFVELPGEGYRDRLPEWTEESFPGALLNVAAGRVSNRFDFGGTNFVVDAACASSLAAVYLACNELESGRSDMAIAGGVDTVQSPFTYLCFSKTQALSPSGKVRTFDRKSDGIVISEGLAVVVLKRLADAQRDGDRIYGVIKAAAGSSDGKALGLTAPLPAGQMRALDRAYRKAGFEMSSVGLVEAHGTGTQVGDAAEAETVTRTLRQHGTKPKSVVLGSVKTQIGHTKATAGVAGLVKVALALHHRVLPPHLGVETPLDKIGDPESPVYLLKKPRPWFAPADGQPRRAAVSAFGFGGTNFHAVLEEYRDEYRAEARPLGASAWPCELYLFAGADRAALKAEVAGVSEALAAGSRPPAADLAYSLALRASAHPGPVRAAIAAAGLDKLAEDLGKLIAHLDRQAPLPPNVSLADRPVDGKLAFLFPGQGSQSPDMLREAALYLPEIRAAVEAADREIDLGGERTLSQVIYPPAAFGEAEEKAQQAAITDTRVAQPAIGTLSVGIHDFLTRIGIAPAMACGHSYGEYSALAAAGALPRPAFFKLSRERGEAMAECSRNTDGGMAAVAAKRDEVARRIADFPGLVVANHNTPQQTVVSGPREAIARFVEAMQAQDINASPLPVAGAFHSPLMQAARDRLAGAIASSPMAEPAFPVFGNRDGSPYAGDLPAIRERLSNHLLGAVEFVACIESMYAAGARLFVEVGPRGVLTGLTRQILADRPHTAVSTDSASGQFQSVLAAVGTLFAQGVAVDAAALFAGRNVNEINVAALASFIPAAPAPNTWLLSGGYARPLGAPAGRTGKEPALNADVIETARAQEIARLAPPGPAFAGASSPAPAAPPAAMPAAPATIDVGAFAAYQETMRQFLQLQESVMARFMGAPAVPTAPAAQGVIPTGPLMPTATPAQIAAPAPIAAALQAPAIAPAPAPGLERAGLTAQLLALVSERTGYPTEMLGLNQDMEAELGIDSIKRVEILGALQKMLPAQVAETVKGKMESFTRVKTLAGLIDAVLAAAPAQPAPALPAPAPAVAAVAAAPAAPALERNSLTAQLLALVSERTGYPTEMLGLNQDMEAELGIDSIKRVEILGALQKMLPAQLAETVKGKMESFTRVKTLAGLIDDLLQSNHAQAPASIAISAAPAAAKISSPAAEVPRFAPFPLAAPLPADSASVKLRGLYLITADSQGVADLVAQGLRQTGATPVVLPAAILDNAEVLASTVADLRYSHGPVNGLIHLAALGDTAMPETFAEWRSLVRRDTKSFFQLLQLSLVDLEASSVASGGGRICAATSFGGQFGRDALGSGNPAGGGATGLLKTLVAEHPTLHAKALDFAPDQSPEEIAEALLTEILCTDKRVEVGFPKGERSIFVTRPCPLPAGSDASPRLAPAADWVVLATGGARGITAEVLEELIVPGMTLVLVGRTPLPEPETAELAALTDAAALRDWFIRAARSRGEAATPVLIRQQVQALQNAREIGATFARMARLGAQVDYRVADVAQAGQMNALVDSVLGQYGKVDLLVLGAGVIEDKLIADKTAESFDRVVDTKVDSAWLLLQRLAPQAKAVCLFASVAGRYGNRGQADYAMANEILNRLGWWWQSRMPGRLVAINWGPWDSTGMASEEVKQQFRERGVEAIPIAGGRRFFVDEIRRGQRGEVEIVAGVGPWEQHDDQRSLLHPRSGIARPVVFSAQSQADGTVTAKRSFDLATDPWLGDHRLDGKPVLPVACALEWMARTVAAGWPDQQAIAVKGLRQMRGVILESGPAATRLVARASSHADSEHLQVAVEMQPASGVPAHYRASVLLSPHAPANARPSLAPVSGGENLPVEQVYRDYLFHGKLFQALQSVHIAREGIRAIALPATWEAAEGGEWLFDPVLTDAILQLVMVWSRHIHGTSALPTQIGSLERFTRPVSGEPLEINFRVHPESDGYSIHYDAEVLTRNGDLVLRLTDGSSHGSAALNRLAGAEA